MQLKLAENIKKYRKDMGLTQEGLADALGVTVGAVSKWENGNNVPDVVMMMALADFFNISMDELLGFQLSSKKIEDMCKKIDTLARKHRFDEAIMIAKDAMVRYPQTFKVLYTCGDMYNYKFFETRAKKDSEKAIRIFEKALEFVSQSEEKELMEFAINSKMAYLYRKIDPEKAINLLQRINFDGWQCNEIGVVLLDMGKNEEALENFSMALLKIFAEQLTTVNNMSEALMGTGKRADLRNAANLVETELKIVNDYGNPGEVNITYKLRALLCILMAYLLSFMDKQDQMEEYVKEAFELAIYFDEAKIVDDFFVGLRYNYFSKEKVKAYDATGTNAIDSIGAVIKKKLDDTPEKNKEKIKRVLDCWERLCESREL
ncbi:MAG: helix-turn-helix domain-containing protein [Agathobacter sp.]|uniref:helix-turn-helix domain-containing protein n=1 Tax=Agathobacter sp. TaxID=2021311 RepID=UPI00258C6851|nr:helix-turn-helix transcriptional regulator [Agathobacter sp.]MCR5678259.1 helix-turn-helix domain-containing protein [Agathobacter sp.]